MKKTLLTIATLAFSVVAFAQTEDEKVDVNSFFEKYYSMAKGGDAAQAETPKATWSLPVVDGLGLGWGGAFDRAPGIRYTSMFLGDLYVKNVVGIKYTSASKDFQASIGISYDRRCIRTQGNNIWDKEEDALVISPIPEGSVKHSRLYVHSLTVPVLFTINFTKGHEGITFGPELIYNISANSVTKVKGPDGTSISYNKSGFKPEKVQFGIYVSSDLIFGLPLFFRWQPGKIFDTANGPKMGFYSFGLML